MAQPQFNLGLSAIMSQIKGATTFSDAQQIAAKIITVDNLESLEFVKKIEHHIMDPQNIIPLQLKINIFETMAALLLTEQKNRFLKHLVPRIHYFLKKYTIRISDSKDKSKRIIQVFKKWDYAQVFCPRFYTKLRDIADSIYVCNLEQKAPLFKKYTKYQLREYRDIWKVDLTKILYDSYQIKASCEQQFKTLKTQFGDVRKITQSSNEKKLKAADLKQKVQQTIEKLMKSLQLNKKGFRLLYQVLEKQKQGLELDTKQEYIAANV